MVRRLEAKCGATLVEDCIRQKTIGPWKKMTQEGIERIIRKGIHDVIGFCNVETNLLHSTNLFHTYKKIMGTTLVTMP